MNYHYLPIYALSAALGGSYYLGYIPPIIFFIFAISSMLTYFIYAKDKQAAKNDQWRISESTLHLYSLLFGWPGAIVAQQKLRHKSKKQSFRTVFMFTVIINVALIAALHTNDGSQILRSYTNKLENFISINVGNQQINSAITFLLKFRKDNFLYKESATFYIRES